MKHSTILTVFTVISTLFASTGSGYAQQDFAKLATTLAAEHPSLDALKHFQDSLNELLVIRTFPDAQLGSAQHIIEGLQFGDIEMGVLPLESVSLRAPSIAMIGIPYLFRDDTHRNQVMDGPLGKQFLKALDELNLVGLGFLETGPRFFLSKDQPLDSLENFQDRTIALVCHLSENECRNQVRELTVQSLNVMGGRPTIISLETLQESLKSEKPDAVEYLPFIGMERHLKESEFNMLTLPAHRTIPTILVAGKRWFDALSPQTREAIARASNRLVRQQKKVMEEALRHEYAALQAQGVEIAEEEREGLQEAVQALYKERPEQFGPEFEQFLQAVQMIR
ncbi:MAG: hypothetical protein GY801_23115 [bacterium]|nr:hypothetical protein [bacterium]